MNFVQRLREVLHLEDPPPTDERSIKAKRLEELAAEVDETSAAIGEIKKQAELGSYHRVSVGPRR